MRIQTRDDTSFMVLSRTQLCPRHVRGGGTWNGYSYPSDVYPVLFTTRSEDTHKEHDQRISRLITASPEVEIMTGSTEHKLKYHRHDYNAVFHHKVEGSLQNYKSDLIEETGFNPARIYLLPAERGRSYSESSDGYTTWTGKTYSCYIRTEIIRAESTFVDILTSYFGMDYRTQYRIDGYWGAALCRVARPADTRDEVTLLANLPVWDYDEFLTSLRSQYRSFSSSSDLYGKYSGVARCLGDAPQHKLRYPDRHVANVGVIQVEYYTRNGPSAELEHFFLEYSQDDCIHYSTRCRDYLAAISEAWKPPPFSETITVRPDKDASKGWGVFGYYNGIHNTDQLMRAPKSELGEEDVLQNVRRSMCNDEFASTIRTCYSPCFLAYRALQRINIADNNGMAYIKDLLNLASSFKSQGENLSNLAKKLFRSGHSVHQVNSAVKSAASLWLGEHYGTRLMINDTKSYIRYLEKLGRDLGIAKCQASTVTAFKDFTVHRRLHILYDNLVEEKQYMAEFLKRLDITPSLENAWDMVPYSFIVDWFIDIGDTLTVIDNLFHIQTSYKVIGSMDSTRAYRILKRYEDPSGAIGWWGTATEIVYSRAISRSIPIPIQASDDDASPSLSVLIKHLGESLALLVQKLR